jgi:hypothetical protein
VRLTAAGETATLIVGGGAVKLTVAVPGLILSEELTALTVTGAEGTVAGAVYSPEPVMVPTVELPPAMP